jgi:hypothetical protein
MKYNCDICDYHTEDPANYSRHKNTKKHIQNMQQKVIHVAKSIDNVSTTYDISINQDIKKTNQNFVCEKCNSEFNFKNNYYRHRKNCKIENKFDEIKELKLKLEYEKKEKELYKNLEKEKTELLNTFMHSANKIINKEQDNNKVTTDALKSVSMSAIKYANEKFKNTPALLPLNNFNLNDLDFDDEEDKKKLVEILIYNAKQNSLDKLLGDHIVKEYKKDNPEDQPFHTTDCSRLNYIVRELIETALIWSTDKSGIKICTSIIKPLIKKCINALLEHQKYLLQEMGRGEYHVQKDVEVIINVLMTIESGNLEVEINKYIAPYFNLNKKANE